MSSFGENLKKIRKEKKLTQSDLAQKMNVSNMFISIYESDKRNPKPETIQKFKEALNCSYEDLGLEQFTFEGSYILTVKENNHDKFIEIYEKPSDKSNTTENIIKAIDNLNDEGKEKVLTYIYDLLDCPKYRIPIF